MHTTLGLVQTIGLLSVQDVHCALAFVDKHITMLEAQATVVLIPLCYLVLYSFLSHTHIQSTKTSSSIHLVTHIHISETLT
jgi:hypothetical protein